MNAFTLQFLWKFDDAYRVEGAFLDADSAARAEVFIDYWFLLAFNELDRVASIEYFRAESIAGDSAIIWLTVFLIERSYS
jgi:hypothetical protein